MAGTVVETSEQNGPVGVITLTCTADAADGSFPATALLAGISGKIVRLVVNPGSPAPTDLYDLTLDDEDGFDVLQGLGANLLTATAEDKSVVLSGTEIHPHVTRSNTLTATLTNNSTNSAVTVIKIYFEGRLVPEGT